MEIDLHSHLYPSTVLEFLATHGREDLLRGPRHGLDVTRRIEDMIANNVDSQVLSFVGPNVVVADVGVATEASHLVNAVYRDVRAANPGRFLAFANLPMPYVDAALVVARDVLSSGAFVGIALPCSIGGQPLDDPQFEPLWNYLDEQRAVVYIHPVGEDSVGHWGLREWGLGAMFGSPLQLGVIAARLVFSGVVRTYPNIRFVLAQEGGFLASRWEAIQNVVLRPGMAGHAPYMLGWVNDLGLDPEDLMRDFRRFWFDTSALHKTPAVLASIRASYGVDRLVLGSDTEFLSLTETVEFLRGTDALTDEERTGILQRGADVLNVR